MIPVAGGEYREGVIGQPVYVNPVIAGDSDVDRSIIALTYASVLDLAADYKVDETGRIHTVSLKEDIFWSDGAPITSDDVIFTVRTIQDAGSYSPLFSTWQGVVVERLSKLQIRFVLRDSYVYFDKNLSRLRVVPEHIFGAIPPANMRLSSYNLEPVASGPYKFLKYNKRRDGFITEYYLARNERFAGEKPMIDSFTFKFYETKEELLKAFNTREVDGFGLPEADIGRTLVGSSIHKLILPSYYAVFFNQSVNSFLKDKNLRLALIKSVDKGRIIQNVFNGNAFEISGPLPFSVDGYSPDAYKNLGYDFDKAKEAFSQVKDIKDGETLEFSMVVPQVKSLMDTAKLIQEDWEKLGIKLNLVIMSPTDVAKDVVKTRNYEMLLFGGLVANESDLFSFWHSSERFYPGLNLSIYSNSQADKFLESIRQTSDNKARSEAVSKLQKIIADDAPALFLYSPTYQYVAVSNLGGFENRFIVTSDDRFQDVEKWFLKTAKVF